MDNKYSNKIITIDGPAGSGKSTIAKILAKDLDLNYIDTGAMYRTITLIAIRNAIDLENEDAILEKARKIKLEVESSVIDERGYTKVSLDGEDVTEEIRSPKVGAAVSIISKLSGIRRYLVAIQKKLASEERAVLEGRDTGSIVCPNALLKIFLTASLSERVKRRKLQLDQKKQKMDISSIQNEITIRDKIDSSRKDSPLVLPDDGVKIDTTGMSIKEVVDRIKQLYYDRTKT